MKLPKQEDDADAAKYIATLKRFTWPLIGSFIAVAFSATLDHFQLVGRLALAISNVALICISALFTSISVLSLIRHRRAVFAGTFALGALLCVSSCLWLIPMYLHGILRP